MKGGTLTQVARLAFQFFRHHVHECNGAGRLLIDHGIGNGQSHLSAADNRHLLSTCFNERDTDVFGIAGTGIINVTRVRNGLVHAPQGQFAQVVFVNCHEKGRTTARGTTTIHGRTRRRRGRGIRKIGHATRFAQRRTATTDLFSNCVKCQAELMDAAERSDLLWRQAGQENASWEKWTLLLCSLISTNISLKTPYPSSFKLES